MNNSKQILVIISVELEKYMNCLFVEYGKITIDKIDCELV
jgi:hypothetical protein